MKKLWAIIRKDTVLRFTGWVEWLFFLILPIVFTLVLAGGTGASQDSRVRLLVVDLAGSPLSAELIAAIDASEAARPDLLSLDKAEDQFSQRRAAALLIIPAEFDLAHLQQGPVELELRRQPNNLSALAASRAVQAAIGRVGSAVDIAHDSVAEAERIAPFDSDAARQAYFSASLRQAQDLLAQAPDRSAVTQGAAEDQIDYDPRANSSAGQLITWVFIPLIGLSGMFAYERQKGTLRRLLTTPTSRSTYLLGTITGQVITALVQMLLLVGFGILVMKLDWGHSPAALAVMLVASVLAAAALGTALGTLVKTEGQAAGLSMTLGMIMALFGGCWYPIELFPQSVRTVVQVFPTTWAMRGMLDLVLRRQGLPPSAIGGLLDILPEAAVLLGFALLFFLVGVWRFRYE
jgi:ABC-2 type transport system permease protein